MKVRSGHNTKRNKKLTRIVLGVTLLLVLGLVIPALITGISRVVMYPIYATETWFRESSDTLPTYLRDKKELIDQIEKLESQLAVAVSTDVTQQRLYEENNNLRELLGAEVEDRIAAAVISRPKQLPYDFLQIDQGSNSGVTIGAPVYIGIDNVIGVVTQVDREFALVQLFTTPGFEATAFISGSNVIAPLEGYGGGVARVRVPQGISLTVGNTVYVPSIQPGVFGRIVYVENKPTQPEQYGYVTLDKPIQSLQYVAVGRQPLQPATEVSVSEAVAAIIAESVRVEASEIHISTSTATSSATSTPTTTESAI